ncbi:MAG: hypothetical protein PWP46_1407 [Fusobacteriaceae bacterium]|jgi:hypothetical protein|nr:hypothetical protein [Fusobacteriaceae bacterium]
MNKKDYFIFFINPISLIFMITLNFLAISLPLNGNSTQELSDKYPSLFTPAGITFSIWSVIYTLIIIFVVIQIYYRIKKEYLITKKSNLYFTISSILNGLWIIAWHYENLILSVIIMLSLLISLILLYYSLKNINFNNNLLTFFIKTPINIYLGWISVATIANISALLLKYNWNGFNISQNIWTIILIIIGGFLAVISILKEKVYSYSIVFIWAYLGIILKRNSSTIIYNDIIYTTYTIIIILLSLILINIFIKIRNK